MISSPFYSLGSKICLVTINNIIPVIYEKPDPKILIVANNLSIPLGFS